MIKRECSICHKDYDLNTLEIKTDEGDYAVPLCGKCWDIIAAVALRLLQSEWGKETIRSTCRMAGPEVIEQEQEEELDALTQKRLDSVKDLS